MSSSTPTELSSIRMDATGLALLNADDEQVGAVEFLDDPTAALALLTEMLGAEPVIETSYPFTSSGTPVTVYRWGGLLLQVALDPALPDERRMGANFVEASVGPIRLVGPGGVSVGDPLSEIPGPTAVESYEGSPNEPRYLLGDPVPVTRYPEPFDEYVQGFADSANATLAELVAPVASFGGPNWKTFAS